MATVTVNVNANTGDATQDINQLDKALEGADVAAEQLNNSLEKQEARIKTLGGAINIVGGSVEVLAGSLALTGALSEEQAEKFESAAIGAIAFADGTKRVFEGVKELNEGLAGVGGITGVVTSGFKKLNTVIRANPYIAAATALAAVTAAVIAFTQAQKNAGDQNVVTNRTIDEQIELLRTQQQVQTGVEQKLLNVQQRAKDLNTTVEAQIEIDKKAAEAAKEKAQQNVFAIEAAINSGRMQGEEAEKQLEIERIRLENAKNQLSLLTDVTAAYGKLQEEAKKAPGGTPEKAVEFFIKPKLVVPKAEEQVDTLAEWFEKQIDVEGAQLRPLDIPARVEADLGETTLLERATVLGGKIGEAMSSPAAQGISANLDAATQLTDSLVQVVDDGSKEAFEKAKKYKIADVVTSSTKAAFDAFAAAQAYGPILGPILGAAQVAAIAVTANRAIQDIRSSTFDSGGVSTPGGVSAPSGFTPSGLGGSQQTLVTSVPPTEATPMRAYVVTGDVTSGIEAEAQLNSRRTFGPG